MTNAADTQSTNPPTRSAGKIIARNTLFGVGAQLALRIASFIFTVLVVRTLGDAHFGRYSIVLAWAALFSFIGDLGVNQYLAREIARDKDAARRMFWDTVVLRLLLAILASVLTVGGAILLTEYDDDIIIGLAIFTSTYFLQAFIAPVQSILTGHERVDILSVLNVVNQVLFMVFAGLFLYLGFGFIWLVLASALNLPIIIILQIYAIRRYRLEIPTFHIHRATWFNLVKAGFPFAVTQVALTFANTVDTVFLSYLTNEQTVGWYNAAYRLTLTLLTVSVAFNTAIMPTLAREHANNPESVRPWYYTSARFIAIFTLPIAVGGAILSNQIVLIYGEEFTASGLAFALLIWDLPFVVFHIFSGYITASIQREGSAARIHTSIGLLNIAINAILIPRFGLIGACLATVLTDFVGAVLFYALFRRELGPGLLFRKIAWVIFAVTLMGILVWELRGQSLILVIPLAALIYGGIIWFSGALKPEERTQIIGLTRRYVPFLNR